MPEWHQRSSSKSITTLSSENLVWNYELMDRFCCRKQTRRWENKGGSLWEVLRSGIQTQGDGLHVLNRNRRLVSGGARSVGDGISPWIILTRGLPDNGNAGKYRHHCCNRECHGRHTKFRKFVRQTLLHESTNRGIQWFCPLALMKLLEEILIVTIGRLLISL